MVLLPAGTKVRGTVAAVKRAGRVGGKSEMTLEFKELTTPDGKSYQLFAQPLAMEGKSTASRETSPRRWAAPSAERSSAGSSEGRRAPARARRPEERPGAVWAVATRGGDIVLDSGSPVKVTLAREFEVPVQLEVGSTVALIAQTGFTYRRTSSSAARVKIGSSRRLCRSAATRTAGSGPPMGAGNEQGERVKILRPIILILALCGTLFCGEEKKPTGPEESPIRALVFAPHPDDETLAFGGLILGLRRQGACPGGRGDLRRRLPRGLRLLEERHSSRAPSIPVRFRDRLHAGGPHRLRPRAPARVRTGDGAPRAARGRPDLPRLPRRHAPDDARSSGFPGFRTLFRGLSETGRTFRGRNLAADLEGLLRAAPEAAVYTTHPADHHRDHAALARFVDARNAISGGARVYFAVVHEPGAINDFAWPAPPCTWSLDWTRRGERYSPLAALTPPPALPESAIVFPLQEELWNPARRDPPLLRAAVDLYKTQAGTVLRSGAPPEDRYLGCIDGYGLLLAFVKRNALFWPEGSAAAAAGAQDGAFPH